LSSSALTSLHQPPTAFKASPKFLPRPPTSQHKTSMRDNMEAARRMGFKEGVKREIGFDVEYPHRKSPAAPPHLQKDHRTSTCSSKTGTPSIPPPQELQHTSTPLETVRHHHPTPASMHAGFLTTTKAASVGMTRRTTHISTPSTPSNSTRTTPKNQRSPSLISSPCRTRARGVLR
jgi:hypothetical protein